MNRNQNSAVLPQYAPVGAYAYSTQNPHQVTTQPRWQPFPAGVDGIFSKSVTAFQSAPADHQSTATRQVTKTGPSPLLMGVGIILAAALGLGVMRAISKGKK